MCYLGCMATKWKQPFIKASFCLNPRMSPVKDAFAWGHHPRIPHHQHKLCEDKTLTPTENYHGNPENGPLEKDMIFGNPSIVRCTSEQENKNSSSQSQAPRNSPTSPSTLRSGYHFMYITFTNTQHIGRGYKHLKCLNGLRPGRSPQPKIQDGGSGFHN